MTRWFCALDGVRRSNTKTCESDVTALKREGLCGEYWTLYVHECVGIVEIDCGTFGFQTLIVPSHELDKKVSFVIKFQWTEKTSRLCSDQDAIGYWFSVMSNSLTLPSPVPTTIWFSWASLQVVSNRASLVSNLDTVSITD